MTKHLIGIVDKISGQNTLSVKIKRKVKHPIYQKTTTVSKTILVHHENSSAKIGDKITIVETKPYSKRKYFRIEK